MDVSEVRAEVEKATRQSVLLRRRQVRVTAVEATAMRTVRIAYTAPAGDGVYESAAVEDYFDDESNERFVLEHHATSVIVANFEESLATKVRPPRS